MSTSPDFNPYEAPKTVDFVAAGLDQISYDGTALIIPKHFTFPPVCIKTGVATDLVPQRQRKLSWYPPLLALLILLNILIFIIVAACVSKRGKILFQISREVAQKRRNTILRNWGIFALSLLIGAIGIAYNNVPVGITSVVLLLITLVLSVKASRFLWAKRIDKTHIWLCGVSEPVARALVASHGRQISV